MLIERIGAIWLKVKALVHRRRLDRDLDDELAFHLAMRAQDQGDDAAAYAAAKRQFGNATRVRETCRELWTFAAMETLRQDARYAVRALAKTPAFSMVAIVSLALGIGANTALFSLADVMLLRALPVKNPQELVEFVRAHPDGSRMTNLPYSVFEYFRREGSLVADVFAIKGSDAALQSGGIAESARVHEVSGSFFPALAVPALMGRTIGPEDDRPGAANHAAVMSYGFWSRRFGRDPSIVGGTVRLSGERFTVSGVMPPEFFGVDRRRVPDVWVPLSLDQNPGEVWVLGRLRAGVTPQRARSQLEPVFAQALESMRDEFQRSPERERKAFLAQRLLVNRATEGTSGMRWTYWDYSGTLKILIGLTGLVLLIACANLANLLMARSAARTHEIGIRLAMGAGRWRLVRQLMTENLLLSLVGGAMGLAVAAWGHELMLGYLVRDRLSVALDFRLDQRLLGFGVALSVATGLLFGLMPAIRATRADIISSIHGAGRHTARFNVPFAKGLLTVQIGLSMVLLLGAGLFARSLRNLGAAELGFARENLLLMDVAPSGKTPQAAQEFWTELMRRLPAVPLVRGAALAGDAVFGNGGWNQTVWVENPGQAARNVTVAFNLVSPGFFATAGIPVLTGREFGEQDRERAPLVAVVNRTFARRFFPGEDPVGKRFGGDRASSGRYGIVGVVGDAKYGSVRERTRAMVFRPLGQEPPLDSAVLHVRAASDPTALAASIRREIQAIDREALLTDARTLPQVIRDDLRRDRMFATLASFFALLALALGAIGIYGIVAYRVARRTAEIGVRIALGAQKGDVLWLVMRETLVLLAAGALLGVPAGLTAARLIKSLLFGLDPADPVTVGGAMLVLFGAGTLAGFLPARRAAAVEPTAALRSE
ncbi:MAG TPA: ABC transporter permease [Bryobacteraceae bacterium]|nr:ABC transporter permease [Bryobacteraceae bacterium]